MVQISFEEFVEMVREIETLRHEVETLKTANDFLNKQIKDYNAKYATKYKDNTKCGANTIQKL